MLGPVGDMECALDLIEHLEAIPVEPTEECLKRAFREYRRSGRESDA